MSADGDTPERLDEPGAEVVIPPTPTPTETELWLDTPFAVDPVFRAGSAGRGRYSLGWQKWPDRKGGPGFVTIRRAALGVLKVVNRYPLTDEGWAEAWRELASLDSAAAEKVRGVLAMRAAEPPPAPPAEPEPPESWKPMTAAERKAMTPEQKRARRRQWRAMTPTERREAIDESAELHRQERVASGKGESWVTRLANNPIYTGLGVRVRDGQVYKYPAFGQPPLGPLAGARAEITDSTKAQMVRAGLAAGITSGVALGAVLGPFALAPGAVGLLRKSKAVVFVVCANGKLHEKKLDGTAAIRAAQRDAVRFNTLAGPVEAPAPEPAQPPPTPPTPGERLAEVTRLYDEGLLTDEEYQAKRAEIIGQL